MCAIHANVLTKNSNVNAALVTIVPMGAAAAAAVVQIQNQREPVLGIRVGPGVYAKRK